MLINLTHDNLNSKQLLGQGGHARTVHQERAICSLLPSQPPGSQIPHCSGCRTTQLQEEKQLGVASPLHWQQSVRDWNPPAAHGQGLHTLGQRRDLKPATKPAAR